MPGTPDPVLGSNGLTLALASAVGILVAVLPYVVREYPFTRRRFAFGGGLAYAVLCLVAWGGARYLTDSFASSLFERPDALVALLLWSTLVLVAQAGVPLYLSARWNLRVPLVALFVSTTLVLYAFLRVRGESDPLALYSLFFGPMVIAVTCVLGVIEAGVRRLVARAS